VNYHGAALLYARAAHDDQRGLDWARWAFLSEAMAQHFLQDSFSAGHMVGARGGVPDRIGTHDYYCEHGIEARSWRGSKDYFAHGDGFMSTPELDIVAAASERSFDQIAHAFYDELVALPPAIRQAIEILQASAPPKRDLDVCNGTEMGAALEPLADAPFVDEVIELWPTPVPDQPLPPRFPAELLFYAGVSTQAFFAGQWSTSGGAASGQVVGLGGVTLGVAAEGISARRMEATGYIDFYLVGARWRDATSIFNLPAAIHVHAPFAYVPLIDGVIFGLLAEKTDWAWVGKPAYAAANGTAYGSFEAVHHWDPITFQVVVGRDVTVAWFRTKDRNQTEWDVLLPLVEVGQLPSLTLNTAFEWNVASGIELSRTFTNDATALHPASPRTDVYVGAYLAFLNQTRIVAIP
jgi:hypothetical protein